MLKEPLIDRTWEGWQTFLHHRLANASWIIGACFRAVILVRVEKLQMQSTVLVGRICPVGPQQTRLLSHLQCSDPGTVVFPKPTNPASLLLQGGLRSACNVWLFSFYSQDQSFSGTFSKKNGDDKTPHHVWVQYNLASLMARDICSERCNGREICFFTSFFLQPVMLPSVLLTPSNSGEQFGIRITTYVHVE